MIRIIINLNESKVKNHNIFAMVESQNQQFESIKKVANNLLISAINNKSHPEIAKDEMIQAESLFKTALETPNITSKDKSSAYKNLIKVYDEIAKLEPVRQLKLYYFDRAMEMVDKALYFGLETQEE